MPTNKDARPRKKAIDINPMRARPAIQLLLLSSCSYVYLSKLGWDWGLRLKLSWGVVYEPKLVGY